MENFTSCSALLGGVLLGTSATLLLWMNGQIAGISGIFGDALKMRTTDRFMFAFIVGNFLAIRWQPLKN